MRETHQPLPLNERIIIVDVLRGWALLGVVLMNYFDFFTLGKDWQNFKPDLLTNTLLYTCSLVFAAKSWTLLSVLFGYGFAVLMDNLKKKGANTISFFAGRMFWLLLLAAINSALFFGDILKDYAILGLILLLFHKSSAKTAFIASSILFLSLPALAAYVGTLPNESQKVFTQLFPMYQSDNLLTVLWFGLKGTYYSEVISKPYLYTVHAAMFCCFLWGFVLYKVNFFNNLTQKISYLKKAFWLSLVVSILLMLLLALVKQQKLTLFNYYDLNYWVVLNTMVFIAATICWLYAIGKFQSFFSGLAIMGKMTLTNYMTQNLIGLLLFSGFGFGIWNTQPLWFYLLVAIVVYISQIFFSRWWLSKYNYGPVEWIWRQLSYWKKLPLKKQ